MKKILLIFVSVILTLNFLHAQSVNGIQLKDLDVNYLRIYGRTNFVGNKMVVRFEFGQRVRFFDSKNRNVTDSQGRRITFNTMIDALNFISAYGYRLVQTYNTVSGSTVYYHYIMEKIGLINNNGVNSYQNNQNNHYERSINNTQDENYIKVKQEENNPEVKDLEGDKIKGEKNDGVKRALDKVSNVFKKEKNKAESVEEKKVANEISCTKCQGKGEISKTCSTIECKDGKAQETCEVCSGKYSDGNQECYKCEGQGCDYCTYDGKACDNCKNGKKQTEHSDCNGIGIITKECTDCGGTGKVK